MSTKRRVFTVITNAAKLVSLQIQKELYYLCSRIDKRGPGFVLTLLSPNIKVICSKHAFREQLRAFLTKQNTAFRQ